MNQLKHLIEKAEANWQFVTVGKLAGKNRGLYSYGDAPVAIGGGVGVFTWLENRDAMLNFIEATFPYCLLAKAILTGNL